MVNKQLQCKYCPISEEAKAFRRWKLVSQYNITWETFFLKKSYTRCGGETIPGPFSKKVKIEDILDQYSKVSYSLFLLYAKVSVINTYWN